jgi:hypothetical protein
MPNRWVSRLAASVLALGAGAALAQPGSAPPAPAKPAPNTVGAVTVEAPAPPKVVEQRSYHFVQKNESKGNPELEQIVRWRDPICVTVSGVIERQEQAIEKRIEEVAQAVDLHVRKPGCHANIEIVFTDHPQDVMDTVWKRREYMLGYYHRHDGVRLKKVTRPIQAWHVTATIGDHPGVDGAEIIDDQDNMPPSGCGISHIFTNCYQGVLKNVLVVVDSNRVGDNSLGTGAASCRASSTSTPRPVPAATPPTA